MSMGEIPEMSEPAFVDPFEQPWDADEMAGKHAEYKRLLADTMIDENVQDVEPQLDSGSGMGAAIPDPGLDPEDALPGIAPDVPEPTTESGE